MSRRKKDDAVELGSGARRPKQRPPAEAIVETVRLVEQRKEFWRGASDAEMLMCLCQDADAVTFWTEDVPYGVEGKVRRFYRAEAVVDRGSHQFGALSTDEYGESPGAALTEVLLAVLASYGGQHTWGDWWMKGRTEHLWHAGEMVMYRWERPTDGATEGSP